MAQESEYADIPFESRRVPLDRSIELRFDHFSGFARRYAADISMGGMFIRTAEMKPPGSSFEFNFQLGDGQPLITGTAEVVWCRPKNQGRHRPRGLGVRFLNLDLESKLVIYRLVDAHIQSSGTPFDLGSEEAGKRAYAAAARRRAFRWALAVLATLAVGSALGFWLVSRPDGSHQEASSGEFDTGPAAAAVEEGGSPAARPAPPESPVAPTVTPSAERPPPPAERPSEPADQVAAVEAAIDAWKRAWSAKDADMYLSCYSEDFRPASGLPLSVWKSQRRERLARPLFIEIEISALEVEIVAADRATTRFDQTYTSPGYRDRVSKSLELVHRQGEWQVVKEEVLANLAPD